MQVDVENFEIVRPNFDPARLLASQNLARKVVRNTVREFVPGMRETEARRLMVAALAQAGAKKFWHPVHVRFGQNTLMGFREKASYDPQLQQEDIFFVDIGPVFDGYEGDFGETFVVGRSELYWEAKRVSEELWREGCEYWKEMQPSGKDLYRYINDQTEKKGWELHPSYVRGHRLEQFPHKLICNKNLEDMDAPVGACRWVLEIQIQHSDQPFGAFYEDLIV